MGKRSFDLSTKGNKNNKYHSISASSQVAVLLSSAIFLLSELISTGFFHTHTHTYRSTQLFGRSSTYSKDIVRYWADVGRVHTLDVDLFNCAAWPRQGFDPFVPGPEQVEPDPSPTRKAPQKQHLEKEKKKK